MEPQIHTWRPAATAKPRKHGGQREEPYRVKVKGKGEELSRKEAGGRIVVVLVAAKPCRP
jgi:hypothetical protein